MTITKHAGEIVKLITEKFTDKEFSKEELIELLEKELNCKAENLTIINCFDTKLNVDELIEFLTSKNKIIKKEDKFCLSNSDCSCHEKSA